jgi:hypothetical protein
LMDFKTFRTNNALFYKLYVDDGNILKFYDKSPSSGKIRVSDGKSNVKITMRDSHGNMSDVSFTLLSTPLVKEAMFLETMKNPIEYDIQENVMIVSAQPCPGDSSQALMYRQGVSHPITADYFNKVRSVYLIDLRKEIPDSIVICGKSIVPHIKATIPSGRNYQYYSDLMDIEFPEKALYDTVYLNVRHVVNPDSAESFIIGQRTAPLDRSMRITIRPGHPIQWDKTYAVYRVSGKSYSHLGGGYENGGIHFASREFGEFTILRDTVPPTIKPISINQTAARFKIRDDLSGISSFEATINGKWLLMYHDSKSATIWSEKLNKAEPLKGELRLVVKDQSGNETTYTHKL